MSTEPTLQYNNAYVENVPPVGSVKIRLPIALEPKSIYLALGNYPVTWNWENGFLNAIVKNVDIYNI